MTDSVLERRLTALETNDDTNDLRIQIEQLQEKIAILENHRDQHREILTPLWNEHLNGEVVELEAESTPIWTERINVDSTVKDGYRVKEVTLTVQYEEGARPTETDKKNRLASLIERGQEVADQMNHARNEQQRFFGN